MPSVKLSVTVNATLSAKYPAAARAKIDAAVTKWIATDAARGIATTHVALDDAVAMGKFGAAPVKGRATALRCKRALDALCRKLAPEYVVIIGGDEIVPYFRVANPSFDETGNGDTDTEVPTDNPYACSTGFRSRERKTYLVPDRVLGRITDVDGDADPSWIVDQLARAAAWKPKPRDFYKQIYATCCDEWKAAGDECVRYLGFAPADLMISPPTVDATPAARARLVRTVHMTKCHGSELEATYSGQKGQSFPDILTGAALTGRVTAGTLAAAMCCYGAQIYDPNDPAARPAGALSIAATYLREGAVAMMGATKIAWVGPQVMMCADWIVAGYLKAVLGAASIGRALLESKQDYVRHLSMQGQPPDEPDEKTLIEFILLGDPSVHAVAAVAPAVAGARAARPSAAALAERTQRRAMRAAMAGQIRRALPVRQRAAAPSAAVARKVFQLAAGLLTKSDTAFGLDPAKAYASKLVSGAAAAPAAAARAGVRAAARAPARRESTEYYWSARKVVQGRVQVRLLKVETDKEGNLLRSRLLHSA